MDTQQWAGIIMAAGAGRRQSRAQFAGNGLYLA